ncbi:hypothetical protein [Nonomuraea sp. NPDC050310]|uniref:hypothetical protein n=1 Tax=Nonomuraea sp. NPDC050310 TaxID=3154935 RepID=UPI0033DADBB0
MDVLKMALHDTVPAIFPGPDRAPSELADALWPVLRAIGLHSVTQGLPYCLEGDLVTPDHVTELSRDLPGRIRACFLGFPTVAAEEKVKQLASFAGGPNDWVDRDLDRAGRLAHVEEMKRAGQALAESCRSQGLPFVDTSHAFEASLERAYDRLTGPPV